MTLLELQPRQNSRKNRVIREIAHLPIDVPTVRQGRAGTAITTASNPPPRILLQVLVFPNRVAPNLPTTQQVHRSDVVDLHHAPFTPAVSSHGAALGHTSHHNLAPASNSGLEMRRRGYHSMDFLVDVEGRYICLKCGIKFRTQEPLGEHMRVSHPLHEKIIMIALTGTDSLNEIEEENNPEFQEPETKCSTKGCTTVLNLEDDIHPRGGLRKNCADHRRKVNDKVKLIRYAKQTCWLTRCRRRGLLRT
jgi:hypothetical protein